MRSPGIQPPVNVALRDTAIKLIKTEVIMNFTFGLIGHNGDWRKAQTDWQASRLNDPFVSSDFQT